MQNNARLSEERRGRKRLPTALLYRLVALALVTLVIVPSRGDEPAANVDAVINVSYPNTFLIFSGKGDTYKNYKFVLDVFPVYTTKAGQFTRSEWGYTLNVFKKDPDDKKLAWRWKFNNQKPHILPGPDGKVSAEVYQEEATMSENMRKDVRASTGENPDDVIPPEVYKTATDEAAAVTATAPPTVAQAIAGTDETKLVAEEKKGVDLLSQRFLLGAVTSPHGVIDDAASIPLLPIASNSSPTFGDLLKADRYIATYCAANNNTSGSRGNKEVFGMGQITRHMKKNDQGRWDVIYFSYYLGLAKSTSKSAYKLSPEVDCGHILPNEITEPLAAIGADFPTLDYDKKTGLSQDTTLSLPIQKYGPDKDQSVLAFPIDGSNSFSGDYYSVKAGPSLKLANAISNDVLRDWTIKSDVVKSLSPQGMNTLDKTVGEVGTTGSTYPTGDSSPDQVNFSTTFAYGSYVAGPENTADISGTLWNQEVFCIPTGELDLSTWLKPAESTQYSSFYGDGIGRLHIGSDIPDQTDDPQYARLDFTMTGGGITGVSPTYARFFAGSNYGGGTSSSDVPSPAVRSLGVNSAGVYSNKSSTVMTGATAYGNVNFTAAVPIPGLSWPLLPDANSRKTFAEAAKAGIPEGNNLDRSNIDFIANNEDLFALKPLFAVDAAWLGSPSGFHDRSLVSIGVGAEVTVAVVNFDFIYAKTITDTSLQAKSGNLTFQATYDIHF